MLACWFVRYQATITVLFVVFDSLSLTFFDSFGVHLFGVTFNLLQLFPASVSEFKSITLSLIVICGIEMELSQLASFRSDPLSILSIVGGGLG